MTKFYNTIIDEQEAIITFDYNSRVLNVYTSQKEVYKRLTNKLGQAKNIGHIKNKIASGSWSVSFDEKEKITHILSLALFIKDID